MLRAFDDGRIFGASYGTGRPWVLALHGWQRSHTDFDAVLGTAASSPVAAGRILQETRHAEAGLNAFEACEGEPSRAELDGVAVDLPGFGASPPPPEPWDSLQYARAVEPVLRDLGKSAVVVGHSFGGTVALQLASLHPDRVGALVLTGVPRLLRSPRRSSPLAFRVGRRLHRMGVVADSTMEKLRYRYGSNDYRSSEGVLRDVLVRALAESHEDQLSGLRCPVELVWGGDDTAASPSSAEAAAALIGDCRLTVLPGVGHLVPTLAPEVLRAAIERHRP